MVISNNRRCLLCYVLLVLLKLLTVEGFQLHMMSSSSSGSRDGTIYGVPNSGWSSPMWMWGYGQGTGHDCAMICRQNYATKQSREELVEELFEGKGPTNFEEVKLVLGLAWQKGRWDGSDGGNGGYGDVLTMMANCRYEDGTEEYCSKLLVEDMQKRFTLLKPIQEDLDTMNSLIENHEDNIDVARRKCSSLVLGAMGFTDNGL